MLETGADPAVVGTTLVDRDERQARARNNQDLAAARASRRVLDYPRRRRIARSGATADDVCRWTADGRGVGRPPCRCPRSRCVSSRVHRCPTSLVGTSGGRTASPSTLAWPPPCAAARRASTSAPTSASPDPRCDGTSASCCSGSRRASPVGRPSSRSRPPRRPRSATGCSPASCPGSHAPPSRQSCATVLEAVQLERRLRHEFLPPLNRV